MSSDEVIVAFSVIFVLEAVTIIIGKTFTTLSSGLRGSIRELVFS